MAKPPSSWSMFVNNTTKLVREGAKSVMNLESLHPNTEPRVLFSFRSPESLHHYVTGCDADIGGTSTCNLTMGADGRARFWGDMRLDVKPGYRGKIRGGYAGVRSKARKTLFGEMEDDLSLYHYLVLRLRVGGDPRTHNSYYCNVQTNSMIQTDLFQHRIWFSKPDEWEDVVIPLNAFVLTNFGQVTNRDISLLSERIRTIGVSILGGKSGLEGRYDLGLDHIKAVTEADIDVVPSKFPSGFALGEVELNVNNQNEEQSEREKTNKESAITSSLKRYERKAT